VTDIRSSLDPDEQASDRRRGERLSLQESYEVWERIESQFNETLDLSLDPRGPDMLYDLVGNFALPMGAVALDVGCGKGRHAIELARRFRLKVRGLDPVPLQVEIARNELAEQAISDPLLTENVDFEVGWAEELPAEDASVDLAWCRDVLELVPNLHKAYGELHRVLKSGGRALVYQMFFTDRMEPGEAASLTPPSSRVENMRPNRAETALRRAGLHIDECIVLGTEWAEYSEEQTSLAGRKLLHAARLLRAPERYIQQYGKENYDVALGDCLWHVYRLIGKISYRIYRLTKP
jgi:SAM-dependent methyltransferase